MLSGSSLFLCSRCNRHFTLLFSTWAHSTTTSNIYHHTTSTSNIYHTTPTSNIYHATPSSHLYHTSTTRHRRGDHYETLGLDKKASPKEIKTAYIRLSKELHPDVNKSRDTREADKMNERFIQVNQAYEVLSNERLRRDYDLNQEDPLHHPKRYSYQTYEQTQPPTFEERMKAAGFKAQDPNFYEKHGNYQYTVVKYCVLFMVVGAVLQYSAIYYVAGREKAYTDLASQRNMNLYNKMREGARERALDSPQQQWRGIEKDSREAAQTPAN